MVCQLFSSGIKFYTQENVAFSDRSHSIACVFCSSLDIIAAIFSINRLGVQILNHRLFTTFNRFADPTNVYEMVC